MKIPVYLVDTFTGKAFRGNPTSICCLPEHLSEKTMQLIAKEFNQPVTVFVKKDTDKATAFTIRYFTPATEIPACGHGSIGAGWLIATTESITDFTFCPISRPAIPVKLRGNKISIEYPLYATIHREIDRELMKSLPLEEYKWSGYSPELETLFIEIKDPAMLRNIRPDYSQMIKAGNGITEVVITSVSDDARFDFLLRSFCPWIGIDEDPVTGSVHAVLAGYWKNKLNRSSLTAYQASDRGGTVMLHAKEKTVALSGECVMVLQGEMISYG